MSEYVSSMIKYAHSGDSFTILVKNNLKQIKEKQFSLAYIDCPRFRKEGDEPFAFEAQEHSRRLVVGRPASTCTFNVAPTTKREYGCIRTEFDLTESLLRAGLAKLRPEAVRREANNENPYFKSLEEAQTAAQQAKLGKKLNGIIENIRDGDQLRVRLLLKPRRHQYINVSLAGVRCPRATHTYGNQPATEEEPFGNAARQFVEARLLQRNVVIELLGVTPNDTSFIANVIHPAGNIAHVLLSGGLGRVADNHSVYLGPEAMQNLRSIERKAKTSNLGIWKDVKLPNIGSLSLREYSGTVSRVISTDTLEVRRDDGSETRLQLSSIRHPRPSNEKEAPYQFDAREFFRKKTVGKPVNVSLDFVRPAQNGLPEINACTVTFNDGTNLAMLAVENGYASVLRHRADDVDRSPVYDYLIQAEKSAQEAKKGMWSGKKPQFDAIVNASETPLRSRQYLSSLQRNRKLSVVIDNVISGSRFRCFCPKENCSFMFACAGIRTPRTARNIHEKEEPFASDSFNFAKSLLQQEVEVEVLSVDNNSCFLGDLIVNRSSNFALDLLNQGLAWCQGYSNQSNIQYTQYHDAEASAKEKKSGMWHNYAPEVVQEKSDVPSHPTTSEPLYLDVALSDIADDGKFSFQVAGPNIQELESLMSELSNYQKSAQPLDRYNVGINVAAVSTLDNAIYRGKILRCNRENLNADVLLYDYGSVEQIPFKNLYTLPEKFSKLKPQAQLSRLTFVQLPPPNSDYYEDARLVFRELAMNKGLVAKIDGKTNNFVSVTLYNPSDGFEFSDCINTQLVALGMASVIPKRKLAPFEKDSESLNILQDCQQQARLNHIGMWVYGDPLEYEE
ncbi:RNA-binding protein Snd1 [Schizosaccharomyces cryophilus OY26]|uniref:RNA-binding protein Snd1 n=1 Tax=Schizosaccharomyces cryophilus (strain OY26 / ATCC MYA-4695 / CBS 11777 / NBRC 106824 / NRRL Y48691) TaxID=653667 RepID=S9VX91_SCHCR|nr:RNA-binding protein Snd1 [Schizosaccharomyces cryophilus OY26]EPY50615.1 RNA-binding protein Snd1 [Schizosaccharomyces cryophilus OY26]